MNRSLLVKQLPCLCCQIERKSQPNATEAHHLNQFGLAGKKRLGDEAQIPLCGHHHRGLLIPGKSSADMLYEYGPSLSGNMRMFRKTYGTDQELLDMTNRQLESVA
jgi:hypothetical protein